MRAIGFARYIVSATTPFTVDDTAGLVVDAPGVVGRVLDRLKADEDPRSDLARAVGAKGYHAVSHG
ncbi:MAG TPA: hypothetical protein VN816_03560 [Acidimicrobiales bacterium]|nr:hypothetical protein [Acidimicrobiales bacterium]